QTVTTLASSSASSVEGGSVTFTARVSARAGNDLPTGNVTLSLDGVDVQTVPLDATGAAAATITFDDNGARRVAARYLGGPGFAASTSATLSEDVANLPPSVGPLAGAPEPVQVGTRIALTASFSDPG